MTYKLSPSSLKVMKDCPTCFWYQIKKKIRRPPSPMSQLPNRIEDQILNRFKKFRDKGELPPELKGIKNKGLINSDLHKEWKNKGISFAYDDDIVIMGKLDDVLEGNNKLLVLDYKTAGKSPEKCTLEHFKEDIVKYDYQMQVDLYNYILRSNGMNTEDYSCFLFIYIESMDENGKIKLGNKLIRINSNLKRVEQVIKEAKEILEKNVPPIGKCEHCKGIEERNN